MQDFMKLLLVCSGTMSALALIYMAVSPMLAKRFAPKGLYYAWLIIMIGLIIPVRPQLGLFNGVISIRPEATVLSIIRPLGGAPDARTGQTTPPFAASSEVPVWQVVTAIWLAGVIVFLAHHFIKHYRFMAMAKRWREPVADKDVLLLFQTIKAELGISAKIDIYQCLSVGSPMLVGFEHSCILLPQADMDQKPLYFILKHELIHYKRKDLYYRLIVLIATALHWFNPVVFLMAKAVGELCELSCDAQVIHNTDAAERLNYSKTIIGAAQYRVKMRSALTTNFYGGKIGMKKRLYAIMDTEKKRSGMVLACIAIAVTLGTGAAFTEKLPADFLPEQNYITSVAYSGDSQSTDTVKWEPLPEYEAFGISYDVNGVMLFQGQVVRYFWDGYEIEPGMGATHYDYFNADGVVDTHTIRSVVDNGDGSVDLFGELLEIAADSQQAFDERDLSWFNYTDGFVEATESVGNSVTGTGGRTFTEIFKGYSEYGIDFVPSTAGGIGNVYYQGQLVKTFVDVQIDGSVFMLQSVDGGDITVRTIYETNGKLTGVKIDN